MAILIKNARVFAPKDLGVVDVLMANERILAVGKDLAPNLPDLQTVEAGGMIMTPGFFDQHIHVTAAAVKAVPPRARPSSCSPNSSPAHDRRRRRLRHRLHDALHPKPSRQGPRPSGRRRLRLDVHVQLPLPADASHRFHRQRPLLHSRGPRREDRPRRPPLELPRRPDGPLHARRHPRRRHARRQDRLPPHPQRQHSRRLRDV